jgi:hypothetical protein
MAQDGVRAEEKERLIAEKEAIWEQLRMDVALMVDDDAEGGRAARRPAEGTIAEYIIRDRAFLMTSSLFSVHTCGCIIKRR